MSLIKYESPIREPLVDGKKTYHDVTEDICHTIEANLHAFMVHRFWYFV
jgi:hypothetical protein